MAARQNSEIIRWLTSNMWVILADAAGLALLISVLLATTGSTALKDWMFVLLTSLPLIAAIMLLSPHCNRASSRHGTIAQPVLERKITIAPRPVEQRAPQAS